MYLQATRPTPIESQVLPMLYTTQKGEVFNTEKDFSSPERHVLQKLFIWREMATSVEEFRGENEKALRAGWNNSGPLKPSPALQSITRDLEAQVARRLRGEARTGNEKRRTP